jgi:hypothetical protein
MTKKKQTPEERRAWFEEHSKRMKARYPKGEQVADNMTWHYVIKLEQTPEGKYYTPIDSIPKRIPYKGEYRPMGKALQFPQEWGRKKAAELLVRTRMEDLERILTQSQRELEALKELYDEIPHWSTDVDWVRGGKNP